MQGDRLDLGHGEIDAFILRALVAKLVERSVLSADDLRELLCDAAAKLRPVGGSLTPQAIHAMVESDLLPPFLERSGDKAATQET